ncbi:MAG: hypothetical protein VB086_10095 [Clostridiaceae bacterium]|nr:hypothetical protein [Clostridiaceae bacterium]
MREWWEALSSLQRIFAFAALPATLVLVIQTVLVIIGLGNDTDTGDSTSVDGIGDGPDGIDGIDAAGGPDGTEEMDAPDDGTADGGDGLALFSIRGIVAFLSVGGWTGIVLDGAGLPPILTVTLAISAGTAALYGIALLFREATRLQSAGNQLLSNAVGKTAKVYIRIPAGGKSEGKVTLTFQGRFSECGAVTTSDRDLKPGEFVRVVGMEDEDTLIVIPAETQLKKQETEVKNG